MEEGLGGVTKTVVSSILCLLHIKSYVYTHIMCVAYLQFLLHTKSETNVLIHYRQWFYKHCDTQYTFL